MAKTKNLVKLGTACVDSGQLMVTDPCYLGQKKLKKGTPNFGVHAGEWDTREPGSTFHYDGACAATTAPNAHGGQLVNECGAPVGVAFRTGYGDGVYPVYAEIKDGRVASVTIYFMDDPEEEGAAG